MKKGFKRFLSGAIATVMAVAGMTVGMATTAMAADYEYGTVTQTSETVKEWGFTTNMPSSSVNIAAGDTINGITVSEVPASGTASKIHSSKYLSMQPGTVFSVPVPANSTGEIYVKAQSGNSGRNVSFKDGNETKELIMNTGTTGNSADFTAAATSSGSITLTAAGGECKIASIQITLSSGSFGEVTTYSWTLDTRGLTNVPADGLALGNNTTTSLTNTLSYNGSGYELKAEYENVSDSTTGVTVDGTNITVKPTDDWFDVVAPKTFVSIEPVVDGNKTEYNFAQTDNTEKYLISINDITKSDTTAYSAFNGVDNVSDDDCNVLLTTDGAKLQDNSKDAPAQLVIPYSASTGKVTVSGTVTPTNGIGSKWKLVDLGCIALSTDTSSNLALTGNNRVASEINAGKVNKNTEIEYSITVDFGSQTVSGYIVNGSNRAEYTNIEFTDVLDDKDNPTGEKVTTMSGVSFVTNNSGCIDEGNDRALTIPSVTITTEASGSATTDTKVLAKDNDNYVITVVKASDVPGYNTVSQEVNGTSIADSNTVYKSIVIDDTEYTADDFGGSEGDFLFASIIVNDNSSDPETVISTIQNSVTSVLK